MMGGHVGPEEGPWGARGFFPSRTSPCSHRVSYKFTLKPSAASEPGHRFNRKKHKVSIFAPGVPEKMDKFEQKKIFFYFKKYSYYLDFFRITMVGKRLKRLMYFVDKSMPGLRRRTRF